MCTIEGLKHHHFIAMPHSVSRVWWQMAKYAHATGTTRTCAEIWTSWLVHQCCMLQYPFISFLTLFWHFFNSCHAVCSFDLGYSLVMFLHFVSSRLLTVVTVTWTFIRCPCFRPLISTRFWLVGPTQVAGICDALKVWNINIRRAGYQYALATPPPPPPDLPSGVIPVSWDRTCHGRGPRTHLSRR